MTDERARRVGANEALFRQVNERIEGLNETFATVTDDFEVICECENLWCIEQIRVSRAVYEQTRARSDRFIVKPGHETEGVEFIIESCQQFVIVEKRAGERKRVAEETDPRAHTDSA
jgi:hypothetical protein